MATYEYEMSNPPTEERQLELWMQHSAGFIFYEDSRKYAIEQIDQKMSEDKKKIAIEAIDNALYGMMMIFDGVSGCLKNNDYSINTETKIQLFKKDGKDNKMIKELVLSNGDGMCMGFQMWKEENFGELKTQKIKK